MGLLQSLRARFSRSSPDEERRALTARTPRRQRSKSHSSLKVERLSTLELPTEQLQSKLARLLSSSSGDSSSEADTHLASASSLAADVEAQIEELSTLLRLQLRHDLQESSLWLVDAFDALATGGHGDAALPDRFIDGLCELMQRANFRLLAQREWEFAQAENFMFTLPVTVAWEKLDSSMISRLFVRHPHVGLQAAQLARRVLVFHRGAGVLRRHRSSSRRSSTSCWTTRSPSRSDGCGAASASASGCRGRPPPPPWRRPSAAKASAPPPPTSPPSGCRRRRASTSAG